MIVKVQLSIFHNDSHNSSKSGYQDSIMLIYNEDRSVRYEADTTEEIRQLMNDRLKAYFEYELDDQNKIIIGKEVNEQNW